MFDDIGQKIKDVAKIGCFIGMGLMVIYGVVFMFTTSFFGGLLIAVLGALAVYASSFTMYGFGELVESAMVLRDAQLKKQQQEQEHEQASTPRRSRMAGNRESSGYSLMQMATQRETQSSKGWRCQKCGKSNTSTALFCTDCGADR